jgi:hypothetical protein
MPTFNITDPADGKVYRITGDTSEGALEALQQMKRGAPGQFTAEGGVEAASPPLSPGATAAGVARSAAGGVPIAGPSLQYDMPAMISALTGKEGTFGERFNASKAAGKEAQAQFERRFPTQASALGVAGSVAATAPAMALAPAAFGATRAPTVGNMAASAFRGAGVGAADAYARGQDPVMGGMVGGGLGGAVPGIARGVGAAAQGVGNLVGSGLPAELRGINPKALEWAAKAAKADGLTDAQITAKFQQLGPQGFRPEHA